MQRLELIKSDENEQIIRAAIDLLKTPKEVATARVMDVEARALLFKGNYLNPSRSRVKAARSDIPGVPYRTITKMLERLRGESVE